MVAVAAGAVCVPLNPAFTQDEYQRYFGELHLAALLTRADLNSASRRVAHILGIPVIDVSARPDEGAGAFSIVGQARQRAADGEFASGADDAFMLLTSGSTSRPKTVPLTHASVCLSARNVGAAIELGARDRLLSVLPLYPWAWLDLRASGRAGCRLQRGLYARLRCNSILWLADGVSTNLVHGGTGNPSSDIEGGGCAQRGRTAILPTARSFGFHVPGARRARRTGSLVWCLRYRHLRHDRGRYPDCRKPFAAAKAGFSRSGGGARDRDSGQSGSAITSRQARRDRAAGSHDNQGLRQ